MLRHKGPSARMSRPWCLRTRAPSKAQHTLDAQYGTLQDVRPPRTLRLARLYSQPAGISERLERIGLDIIDQGTHLSLENIPLVPVDPRKIVRIPLYFTIGIALRLLSSEVKAVYLSVAPRGSRARGLGTGEVYGG